MSAQPGVGGGTGNGAAGETIPGNKRQLQSGAPPLEGEAEGTEFSMAKKARLDAAAVKTEPVEEDEQEEVVEQQLQPSDGVEYGQGGGEERVEGNGLAPELPTEMLYDWIPEGPEHLMCRQVIDGLRQEIVWYRTRLQDVQNGIPICPVCLNNVTLPLELQECRHLFCCHCLYEYVSKNLEQIEQRNLTCPTCRIAITKPPRQPNFYFVEHIKAVRAQRLQGSLPDSAGQGDVAVDDEFEGRREAFDGQVAQLKEWLTQDVGLGGIMPGEPIIDHGDGVMRCPRCTWEVLDGACANCPWVEGDVEEEEEEEEESGGGTEEMDVVEENGEGEEEEGLEGGEAGEEEAAGEEEEEGDGRGGAVEEEEGEGVDEEAVYEAEVELVTDTLVALQEGVAEEDGAEEEQEGGVGEGVEEDEGEYDEEVVDEEHMLQQAAREAPLEAVFDEGGDDDGVLGDEAAGEDDVEDAAGDGGQDAEEDVGEGYGEEEGGEEEEEDYEEGDLQEEQQDLLEGE